MTATVEPPETITVTRKQLLKALEGVLEPDYTAMDSWGTDVYSIDIGNLDDVVDGIFDNFKATS
jgi:hypothetical protein